MHVKEIIIGGITIIALVTLAAFFADHRRKSIDAGELARQLDSLDREHRERQRSLESGFRELGELSESAIASLEGAGAIVERTGRELQSTAANLRDAKNILKNLAVQIEDLQGELDSCRAGLYRIRDLAGLEGGGELKPP
jgi:chromosome segregation ATPase